MVKFVRDAAGSIPKELDGMVERISKSGGTPLVVAENNRVLGVIHLKDFIKGKASRNASHDCGRWDSDRDDNRRQSADGIRDRL